MNELLNVVDVEATCWSGAVPEGAVSEIIEIGLTVVDLGVRERISKHRIVVRPERSTVSEFCTELTGLTQAEVDAGVRFAQACRVLAVEYESGSRPWASWGDYDRKQFERQCAATGVTYPFRALHTNAKALFSEARGTGRRYGMAGALRIAGIPLEGRHHSGADDAWNIGALVLDIAGRIPWRVTTPATA
ncbi:3'-5' exonuclease [Nocardia bovistercoris]|uniref:Exonuclease domain-containing protein n=1 Tax=Nocardia bovistercoris TaxID=2785916 RepID=A0A931N3K6_9NOCA|nr:3'-5' exonuclease [Nocardia bovistercoris]MBH0780740.1 exonuclease domain-containing protein [Nocardia bovistercoris]